MAAANSLKVPPLIRAHSRRLRIGIVAGETSGDILAAGLMAKISQIHPNVQFVGIGGPKMCKQNLTCLFPMDDITMMGLEEGFAKVYSIFKIRRNLSQQLLQKQLDLFVGVDVPDFNLTVEEKLRNVGIPTVHYVSPTVWAWRGYRIKKIKRAVCRMLTLFPFEQSFYDQRQLPATFVGHPAASRVSAYRRNNTREFARDELAGHGQDLIALMPGSRNSEVSKLLPIMLDAAEIISAKYPTTKFVLPIAKKSLEHLIEKSLDSHPNLSISVLDGDSDRVLHAADFVILASGTAALEALLYLTPMVVVYKVSTLTRLMVKAFSHVQFFSMPNHLLHKPIVPELIQEQVTAENIVAELVNYIDRPADVDDLCDQFNEVAKTLGQDSDQLAAQAVLDELNAN